MTCRYACTVKVEYLAHDRLSAVICKDISYGFIGEWGSIVEFIFVKRPHDYPIQYGLARRTRSHGHAMVRALHTTQPYAIPY